MNNFVDLGNNDSTRIIKTLLDPDSLNFNQIKNSAICFVGSNMDCYNHSAFCAADKCLEEAESFILKELPGMQAHIKKKINEFSIGTFSIHIIYLPFPDVDDFRKKFKSIIKG